MSEAKSVRSFGIDRQKATATVTPDELLQGPTGKAGAHDNASAVVTDSYFDLTTVGQFTLKKAGDFVALRGGRAFWDHSANQVTYKKNHDRDFYIGRFADDASLTAISCVVDLNADPNYDLELGTDAFESALVGTPAAGGFGYPVPLGGALLFELDGTNEAQKVDALSVNGFDKDAKAIVEGAFRVLSDGAGTNPDISIGIANGTHSSDADLIAESMFVHLDGNAVDVLAESDDGTTEVVAIDTTVNYTEGSGLANRVEFWIDMRDPADILLYIDGVQVLSGSTFKLDAAVGPLFLLVHVEKTSSGDVYKLAVDWLRARFVDQ